MLHDYGSKLPKNRSLFRTYLWWCPYSYEIKIACSDHFFKLSGNGKQEYFYVAQILAFCYFQVKLYPGTELKV